MSDYQDNKINKCETLKKRSSLPQRERDESLSLSRMFQNN
jgi:hypothetical protein